MLTLFDSGRLTSYLGLPASDPEALALAAQVQAHLETQCRRRDVPFRAAQGGRVERRDGTGGATCWLDYPIETVTSVRLGHDPAAPDVDLDPADPAVLLWRAGTRRLTRVDGGTFGRFGVPLWIQVTYDAQADLPEDAALAVLRVTAAVYNSRGAEEVRTEREGGYSADMAAVAESDPIWQAVVAAYGRKLLG